jgi:hypothetical protein
MKPTDSGTSPEYQRFEDMLKTVLSVTPEEMKHRVEAEKKANGKKKKRAMTSPASHASNVPRNHRD